MIRYFKGNNENTRMASMALFLHMLLALNKDVAPFFYFYLLLWAECIISDD